MNTVRTRYATSPPGYQHVGNIRTALFAWLVARQAKGQFIVRLEDTDRSRLVEGADLHLLECLRVLGINHDEGFDIGGPYASYRQSERLESYKPWAQKLIDAGRAYADPYTAEEVQAFREEARAAKKPFLYRNHRPQNPPVWDGSQPLRFKSEPKAYTWHDEVMGELSAGEEAIDDIILIKSDGYPTYNFAHIIDDAEMHISHVIRGQEFIASTPNYLNLYEALGIERPVLATMPHILGASGTKKLSKRDGAKDVLDYIRDGYLPEALINFIASLGWNDGTEQEVFSIDELIAKFSLDRVGRSGARFDEQRLTWLNGAHIRGLAVDELYTRTAGYWPASSNSFSEEYIKSVLAITQERLKLFSELPMLTEFFFTEPSLDATKTLLDDQKNKQLKKLSADEKRDLLQAATAELEQSDFSLADLETRLNRLIESLHTKPGILFSLVRIATTGAPFSPALFDTLHVLGREKSLSRINAALAVL